MLRFLTPLRRFVRRRSALLYPLVLLAALVTAWELWIVVGDVRRFIAPSPFSVARVVFADPGTFLGPLWTTLKEILIGFGASLAAGVPLAALMVVSRPVRRSLYPLVLLSQVVPKIAFAPLLLIWFGFSLMPKVIIVFLIAFFPIVTDSMVGFRAISMEKLYLARSMGAGPLRVFLQIRLPGALPHIFAGMRIAATFSVSGAVVAEFVAGGSGIGHLLKSSNLTQDTPVLFGSVVYLAVMTLLIFGGLTALERLLLPWHASVRLYRSESQAAVSPAAELG